MKNYTIADGYSEAIPIEELVRLARSDINACANRSEQVIRQCAENIVRTKLCPCASSVDTIVDAVVAEYMAQLGSNR